MSRDLKNRNYCFTIFDCEKYLKQKPAVFPDEIKYLIFQKEKCPTSGKEHFQGYVELTKPSRLGLVKKLFNCEWIHLEKRKGTQDQAITYCKKSETKVDGPWEFGSPGKQGQRTDLDCLKNLEFMKISDFVLEYLPIALKYPNGLRLIKQSFDIATSNRQRDISVTTIIGKPGSGKTKYVYDNHSDIYKLNTNTNGTLWFDGYEGQDVLLIDDFKGWLKYTELLTILDRYPYRCQLKGSFTYAKWTKVFITSNYEIDTWYQSDAIDKGALNRRITNIIHQ